MPYQHSALDQLRSLLRLHYTGCGIDLINIRDFPHGGQNSDVKLVDVVIREVDTWHTVRAIIKTVNLADRHRLVRCQLTRFLTREVVFYTKIFPSLLNYNSSKSLRNRNIFYKTQAHFIGSEKLVELVPKCYFGFSNQLEKSEERKWLSICSCFPLLCSAKPEETGMLVLEDLTKRQDTFICGLERNNLLDFDHVNTALTSLAHLHGSSWRWITKKKLSSSSCNHKDNLSLKDLYSLHDDSWFLGFCFKTIFRMMRKMLKTFLQNRDENYNFICRLDNFMKNEIFGVMKVMWSNKTPSKFETLVHGSFWSSNILFQYPSEELGQIPQKALFVDFGQIGLGNPCRDILSLLYTNTTASFRAKYMELLLNNYFTIFKEYFHGFFFMSSCNYQEFEKNIEESRKYGLAWGLYMVCVGNNIYI